MTCVIHSKTNIKCTPDDCVSWEEESCKAAGDGTDSSDIAVLLDACLFSESEGQVCVSAPLEIPQGLCIALDVCGLGDKLYKPKDDSSTPEPAGEAHRSNLRLEVRKLEL